MESRTFPGTAVGHCLPASLEDGLVNLACFVGGLAVFVGTQGEGFPFAEQLDFHRPGADLTSSAFVGVGILKDSLAPVSRVPLGKPRGNSTTFLGHFIFLAYRQFPGKPVRKGRLHSWPWSFILTSVTMKRQRFVSQRSLSRMFQEAAESWKRQEYQQTIETLERAARLDPANASILLDLGRAYGLRYDYGAAERCFEKAVRVAPRKVEALAEAGGRSQEFGSYDMAKGYFQRASEESGATADVFVTLAELNERHARLPEATQFAERALKLNPTHLRARLARARLDRLSGRLVEAE